MGFAHGTNDAQKTMGIIALALVAGTKSGTFDSLPDWLGFLKTAEPLPGKDLQIAFWIKVLCALTMAVGTASGGWRIIKTLGHKLVKLQPVHGFAAETAGATVLFATAMGMPVTTHVITASIMGVGAAKRWNASSGWWLSKSMGVGFHPARQRRACLRSREIGGTVLIP